jgi:hypothetical protein
MITEENTLVDGQLFVSSTPPMPIAFSVGSDGIAIITDNRLAPTYMSLVELLIENEYIPRPRGSMFIRKSVAPVMVTLPDDFQIIITNADTGVELTRISVSAALSGATISNLPVGSRWTITEVGHQNIPGYMWIGSVPSLPYTVTITEAHVREPLILEIVNNYVANINIDLPPIDLPPEIPFVPITPEVPIIPNVPIYPYEPGEPNYPTEPETPEDPYPGSGVDGDTPPKPSAPSPQTGDTTQLRFYIALLILGIGFAAFGVVKSRKHHL